MEMIYGLQLDVLNYLSNKWRAEISDTEFKKQALEQKLKSLMERSHHRIKDLEELEDKLADANAILYALQLSDAPVEEVFQQENIVQELERQLVDLNYQLDHRPKDFCIKKMEILFLDGRIRILKNKVAIIDEVIGGRVG